MIRFFGLRLFRGIFVLFVLLTFTFVLLHLLPGGPFDTENAVSPEVKVHLEQRYHLDRPVLEQYGAYLKDFLSGNLGISYRYLDQNISDLLREAFPATLLLGFLSLILTIVLGFPLGLLSARYHNTWIDRGTVLLGTVGGCMPTFLFAPILILIFSFGLNILPPALWESPKYYILPVLTLGLKPASMLLRLVRSSALDILHSDFIRTAESKGLSTQVILFKHIFKNSLVPALGLFGPLVAHILSGSFVVESMFAVPGLGHHFVDSVLDRDYPLVMALTLVYGLLLIVSTFVTDVLAFFVDPRIKPQ